LLTRQLHRRCAISAFNLARASPSNKFYVGYIVVFLSFHQEYYVILSLGSSDKPQNPKTPSTVVKTHYNKN